MDNEFMVGKQGDDAIIIIPPRRLSKEKAINLIAWLIVLLDIEDDEINAAVGEVQHS